MKFKTHRAHAKISTGWNVEIFNVKRFQRATDFYKLTVSVSPFFHRKHRSASKNIKVFEKQFALYPNYSIFEIFLGMHEGNAVLFNVAEETQIISLNSLFFA